MDVDQPTDVDVVLGEARDGRARLGGQLELSDRRNSGNGISYRRGWLLGILVEQVSIRNRERPAFGERSTRIVDGRRWVVVRSDAKLDEQQWGRRSITLIGLGDSRAGAGDDYRHCVAGRPSGARDEFLDDEGQIGRSLVESRVTPIDPRGGRPRHGGRRSRPR